MKTFLVIAMWCGRLAVSAAEPAAADNPPPVEPPNPQPPHAWLGLEVAKPDPLVAAQVPSLPPGMGFVVKWVDANGPAKAAGLQAADVLWKLGDQMLVNEGQLAALLRLAKPSDEITLSGFREGRPLEVTLKLGRAPVMKPPLRGDLLDSVILPGQCGGPMRVVNPVERFASYSADEGTAVVRQEGTIYKVRIASPQDEVIYEGELPADGNLDKVPETWRRRVLALRRGLDHALEGRLTPTRQPRPRVVPPPEVKP